MDRSRTSAQSSARRWRGRRDAAKGSPTSAAGPDARIVPVHPADTALIDLVRPGDVVDVVAAAENNPQANPHVVATNVSGVSASAKEKAQTATNDRVVLVALPATSANAVAGAALVQTVTLTLH